MLHNLFKYFASAEHVHEAIVIRIVLQAAKVNFFIGKWYIQVQDLQHFI